MKTLFVATAAFAALVMIAPIGKAHASGPTEHHGPLVRLFQNHANDIALTLTLACGSGSAPESIAYDYCEGHDKAGLNFIGVAYAAQNMFVDPTTEVDDANRMALVLHFTCNHGFEMGEAHNEFVAAKACASEQILRKAIGHAH